MGRFATAGTRRRTRSLTCLVLVFVLVSLIAAVASQPADAGAGKRFFGIVPQTGLERGDFKRMGKGDVGTLRVPIFWSTVDPTSPSGDFDFSSTDFVVGEAARNGVAVLPFLFGTPKWVAKKLDGRSCGSACDTFAPRGKRALAAWRKFVSATVARYGRGGTFWSENPRIPRRPIRAWQIWNEQNSRTFFAPKAKPRLYARLLGAAASAVDKEDRRADVVLGGMPQLAGSRKATAGTKYLRLLYRIRGIEKDFDGVAVHPYGGKLEAVAGQVELFRKEIRRAGDGRTGLWITETGWSSAGGGNPLNVGARGQAQRLRQAFDYFRDRRNRLGIKVVTWFSWADSNVSICDWCSKSGLFTAKLKPKPAWRAFTSFSGGR